MVIERLIPTIEDIFCRAAQAGSTVSYREVYKLFDDEKAPMSDRRDTFEAACRNLCPRETAIMEALFALKSDGYPKHGFYEVFKNVRTDEYRTIAGRTSELDLTFEQKRAIADRERARVWQAFAV